MMTGCGKSLGGLFARFATDEDGATAIEYGLIVSLIFLAIVAAVTSYTEETKLLYSEIESNLTE